MVAEVVGGYLASSIALMTDATHMLTDLIANAIGLFAIWVASKSGGSTLSFGYHRMEILGALTSVMLIWGLTIGLVYEAVQKVIAPEPVDGAIMTIVAIVGLGANVVMTQILKVHNHGLGGDCGHCHGHEDAHHSQPAHNTHAHYEHNAQDHAQTLGCGPCAHHDHHHHHHHQHEHEHHHAIDVHAHDAEEPPAPLPYECSRTKAKQSADVPAEEGSMNLRAAYLHALGDLLQSVGVVTAGTCIWINPDWLIADPICTFIFSFFVLWSTVSILRDAVSILMEGTPRNVDLEHLQDDLTLIPGVVELHDLHVWSLSVGKPVLSVHIVAEQEDMARRIRITKTATRICQDHFKILHTTIQIDFSRNQKDCTTVAHRKCNGYSRSRSN
mmetsp:Transcript_22371/g.55127  ORF Transcript_22371/g.55127 Transcript_22371/m.55127 type:complete len:385 (-) Transcript_22371:591-1745(-)